MHNPRNWLFGKAPTLSVHLRKSTRGTATFDNNGSMQIAGQLAPEFARHVRKAAAALFPSIDKCQEQLRGRNATVPDVSMTDFCVIELATTRPGLVSSLPAFLWAKNFDMTCFILLD